MILGHEASFIRTHSHSSAMQAWEEAAEATSSNHNNETTNKWFEAKDTKTSQEQGLPNQASSMPSLAVLYHPSAPISRDLNDRKGHNNLPTNGLLDDDDKRIIDGAVPFLDQNKSPDLFKRHRRKSLATKALLNAHRKANSLQMSMQDTTTTNNNNNSQWEDDQQNKQSTNPYAETVQEATASPEWASTRRHTAVEMPEVVSFVEANVNTTTAPVKMPEPSLPLNVQQAATLMTSPAFNTVRGSAATASLLQTPPSAKMPPLQPTMTMPEPLITTQPPVEMPIPQVASTFNLDRGTTTSAAPPSAYSVKTPLPPSGALVPESTYDPASLQPPEWTDTQTPATLFAEDDENVLQRVKLVLQQLPPSIRAHLGKEEIVRLVLESMEEVEQVTAINAQQAPLLQHYYPEFTWPTNSAILPSMMPYEYELSPEQQRPVTDHLAMGHVPPASLSANEWYQVNGGGVLPFGWTAEYDYATGSWYYINDSTIPATTTWQDPRLVASLPLLPPHFPPPHLPLTSQQVAAPLARQDADWLANRFGILQSNRQYSDGSRGPVAAELARERKEAKELEEAIQSTKKSIEQANQAANKGQTEQFQQAQEATIRARGKLDRLTYESQLRSAVVPLNMQQYQGITRGYDIDPSLLRRRTHYTDARAPFIPNLPSPNMAIPSQGMAATTTSFSGKFMAKLFKPPNIPNNNYIPTAYSLPPGVKYKASTNVPTPYSIPEVCFAWDMLLRNQRDPNKIPVRY